MQTKKNLCLFNNFAKKKKNNLYEQTYNRLNAYDNFSFNTALTGMASRLKIEKKIRHSQV